jgi:hypothetical protein
MPGGKENPMNAMPPPIDPVQEPFDDEPDPAIDSLLRELLGEDSPPNLVPKAEEIDRDAKNHQTRTNLFSNEELIAAVNHARKEAATPPSTRLPSPSRSRSTIDSKGYASWGAMAIAASVVAVLAIYPWWRSREVRNSIAIQQEKRVFPPMGGGMDQVFDNIEKPQSKSRSKSATEPKPRDQKPQVETKLPSESPDLAQSNEPEPAIPRPTQGSAIEDQVIAIIDEQLAYLWNRLNLVPSQSTDWNALEDRFSQVLIGRLPTDAERAWGRKSASGGRPIESVKALARRWMASDEFDRYWGRALSDYYLDCSLPVQDKQSQAAFEAWLQECVQRNDPLSKIESRLIASDIKTEDAPSFWLRRWTAIGRDSSSNLLASNQQTPAGRKLEQWQALETLALQSARMSGTSVLSVDRIAGESIRSENLVGNAAAFVSVFAPNKANVAPKSRELYVADSEGKVILVPPTFPDGKPIASDDDPRSALSQWFQESPQARGAMINFVWERLLGEPLLPRIGLTDAEGFEERKDLLEFLATEAQSQRSSLRQIVSWIALASPLCFESETLEAKDFLALEPARLASAQKQMRLFARYPGTTPKSSIAERFKDLSGWMKSTEIDASSVLAQPSTNQRPNSKRKTNDPDESRSNLNWSTERVRYELSSLNPYARVVDAAMELAASSLAWDAIVDRAFLACLSRFPSDSERKQADQLLVWSNGDRQAAIARLLNILLGHL